MKQGTPPPCVTTAARRVYAALLDIPSASAAELSSATGLTQPEIHDALECLRSFGLTRMTSTEPMRFHPVSPGSALTTALGPLRRSQEAIQQTIERVQSDLETMGQMYAAHARPATEDTCSEEVVDLSEVRRLITELAHSAQSEILTSQPGGPRDGEVLHEAMERTEAVLSRGISIRTIYQHTAQFSQVTTEYVRMVTDLGGQVRTSAHGFPQTLVFDRTTAIIPLPGSTEGAVLMRNPPAIAFIADAFDRAWSAATPFPLAYKKQRVSETADEVREAIIHLLLQGMTDKQIADRVGLSMRACQRHIASWMQDLGARSRLEAGYLAARCLPR